MTLAAACSDDLTSPPTDVVRESDHFRFVSTTALATSAEIDTGLALAEVYYDDFRDVVGMENAPTRTVTVMLHGNITNETPHVDSLGVVHLWRYSAAAGAYFGLLAHELVHAFRYEYWQRVRPWEWPQSLFYEEGFSEFAAMTMDPEKLGFPFYGYPEDVIAGHWFERDEAVPLQVLRERHEELNKLCEFQAYTERASWFRYIDAAYGRDAVLALAYTEVELNSEVIEDRLGAGLAELDSTWQAWLSARYSAISYAGRLASIYRNTHSGAYICLEGVDF